MKAMVICKVESKGIHTFYLKNNGKEYYLFMQKYKRGVQDFYKKGVLLDRATDYKKSKNDAAIKKTMEKIPIYIKFAEKENDIAVLKKTIKKNRTSSIKY